MDAMLRIGVGIESVTQKKIKKDPSKLGYSDVSFTSTPGESEDQLEVH